MLFCSNPYFKQKKHNQQLPNLPDEQLPKMHSTCASYTTTHEHRTKSNEFVVKDNPTNISSNSGFQKASKKSFDAASLAGKLNLKAVSVNRSSLNQRLSSNNSTTEMPSVDELGPAYRSDTSTNTSGFALNMFQTRKTFAVKTFSKEQREPQCTNPSIGMQPELIQRQHDSDNYNPKSLLIQGNAECQSVNVSSSRPMNSLCQTAHMRPNLSSYPGTSGVHRLHDFADPLPSPASAVASLTRDLESDLNQLELRDWANQGQYVVKPQVTGR